MGADAAFAACEEIKGAADKLTLVFALCLLVCLAVILLETVYFLRQWKRMDQILDDFWNSMGSGEEAEAPAFYSDVQETRESRIVSQLRRIVDGARYKERQALGERDQVMELISDLSHQLKTPLANIIMNTELLQDTSLDEECRAEFLARTRDQAEKLQWLMANLLKASRLENGMIRFEAGYTGIRGTIARAVSAVFAQASAKRLELVTTEFKDIRLWHNPKWTAEAMTNILENAVKYSPEGSSIKITLEELEIYAKVTIADEGIGIPERVQSDIPALLPRKGGGTAGRERIGAVSGAAYLKAGERVYHCIFQRGGGEQILAVFMEGNELSFEIIDEDF